MNFDKKQLRNTLLLLLGALIWGTAFVAQSVGSGYVGPYTFLAARSWLACAFLIVLILLRRGKARKADPGVPFWINGRILLRGGVFCGIALFAASAAQQIGIGTTSTAKAGFLTALYVVLVPLLGVFFGRRPGVKLGICACISLAGLYLRVPGGARYPDPDRRRMDAAALLAAVCVPDYAGGSLQPQAGRCAAELCGIFCNGGPFHYFYVCV